MVGDADLDPVALAAGLLHVHSPPMINITPDPVAFTIGSFPVHWYGIFYALGLAAVYVVLVHEAKRRGENPEIVGNALIIVAIAALIGGRLYHVIDQWAVYAADPIRAILPVVRQPDGSYAFSGFAGLGVPGGIITGTIAAWFLTRRWNLSFWTWADIVAPALFVMQAIGRLGNFFNQELYGPPTTLPWGIAIDCAHRVAAYPCSEYPLTTTHFHPLFLYESLSGLHRRRSRCIWLAAPREAARARRPARDLLHLVRPDAVRPRVLPIRQLDVLRHPGRPDRDARVRRLRHRDHLVPPRSGPPGRIGRDEPTVDAEAAADETATRRRSRRPRPAPRPARNTPDAPPA